MSENGQYMTLMANYTTDTAYVLRTGDYGLNWVEMTYLYHLKWCIYILYYVGKTGKNQMVVLKSQENENSRIYFSIDYGMTWNTHLILILLIPVILLLLITIHQQKEMILLIIII